MQMKMDFDKSHSRSFRFETENKSTKLLRQLNVMVCDNRKKKVSPATILFSKYFS